MEIVRINVAVCNSHYYKTNQTFVLFYIYNGFPITIQMKNNSNHLFNVSVITLYSMYDLLYVLFLHCIS